MNRQLDLLDLLRRQNLERATLLLLGPRQDDDMGQFGGRDLLDARMSDAHFDLLNVANGKQQQRVGIAFSPERQNLVRLLEEDHRRQWFFVVESDFNAVFQGAEARRRGGRGSSRKRRRRSCAGWLTGHNWWGGRRQRVWDFGWRQLSVRQSWRLGIACCCWRKRGGCRWRGQSGWQRRKRSRWRR